MKNIQEIEDLLDLHNIRIINIDKNVKHENIENCFLIKIESNMKFDVMHGDFKKTKDIDIVTVRDLPISGKVVFLEIYKRRFFKCSTTETEKFDFINGSHQFTIRYELYIYDKIKSGETHGMISRKENISVTKIREIEKYYGDIEINKYIGSKRGDNFPKYISLDEISARKGHSDFYSIVYDLKEGVILSILKGHSKEEIEPFFRDELTDIERSRVEVVTMDMWNSYKNITEQYFKNAEIVIDRFHVVKELKKQFDKIRKLVNSDLEENEKKNLKGNRYVLLKNFENTNPDDKFKLLGIMCDKKLHDITIAYEFKEKFHNIFEIKHDFNTAKILLENWIENIIISGLKPLIHFTKTLRNWFTEILNYFHERLSNGVAEGMNNKIKEIKRKSYGFTNIDSFKRRVMISFL